MKNVKFKECNATLAKDQEEYVQLEAFFSDGIVVACYKLSFSDRIRAVFKGRLWLGQMTFGNPFHPQLPSLRKKDLIIERKS